MNALRCFLGSCKAAGMIDWRQFGEVLLRMLRPKSGVGFTVARHRQLCCDLPPRFDIFTLLTAPRQRVASTDRGAERSVLAPGARGCLATEGRGMFSFS